MAEIPSILFVEDDPGYTLLLEEVLHPDLLEKATFVTDGDEALNFLFHRGEYVSIPEDFYPAIIFLDLRMPRVDGFTVLQELRASKRHANIPVIILTTSDSASDRKRALEHGANDLIVKPWDVEDISKKIDLAIQEWLDYPHENLDSQDPGVPANR